MSIGRLSRRAGRTYLRLNRKPFRVVQGHAAGRLPVMPVIGTSRAVRPAVLVHGQSVVRLGAPVLTTSADEVDAIVHTRIDARDTGSTSPLQGTCVRPATGYGTDTPPLGGVRATKFARLAHAGKRDAQRCNIA